LIYLHFLMPKSVSAENLKENILAEVHAWRNLICRHLNVRYKAILLETDAFMSEQLVAMNRPITDLEDVRMVMASLEAVRMKQQDIDMSLGPIEVNCAMSIVYCCFSDCIV